MPDPIRGAGGTPAVQAHREPGSAPRPERGGRVDDAPDTAGTAARPERREPGAFAEALRDAGRSLTRGERTIERAVHAAHRGKVFSQEELIALQAGVYRYAQELELASKLVDKSTSAVRQTLRSQK